MINMIAELTNCEIKVGQNGMIVLDGPPEGVAKATECIELIEQDAHMADLTNKVQKLLGVEPTGQPMEPAGSPDSGES